MKTIAKRVFRGVDAQGESFPIIAHIGEPYPDPTPPPSKAWRCDVLIEPIYKGSIIGADSWQALWLAIGMAHSELADFLRAGGRLYFLNSEDEWTREDFPDTISRWG